MRDASSSMSRSRVYTSRTAACRLWTIPNRCRRPSSTMMSLPCRQSSTVQNRPCRDRAPTTSASLITIRLTAPVRHGFARDPSQVTTHLGLGRPLVQPVQLDGPALHFLGVDLPQGSSVQSRPVSQPHDCPPPRGDPDRLSVSIQPRPQPLRGHPILTRIARVALNRRQRPDQIVPRDHLSQQTIHPDGLRRRLWGSIRLSGPACSPGRLTSPTKERPTPRVGCAHRDRHQPPHPSSRLDVRPYPSRTLCVERDPRWWYGLR